MKSIFYKATLALGAVPAYLVLAISYARSPSGASFLAAAIVIFAFASFVFRENPRAPVNRAYFAMSVLLTMFVLAVYLLHMAPSWGIEAVAPWVRALRNGSLLLGPSMMYFAYTLDGGRSRMLRASVILSAASFAPFVISNALGHYISEYRLTGAVYVPTNALGQYRMVGILTGFWFLAFFGFCVSRLLSPATDASRRTSYRFVVAGGLAAAFLGMVGFLVPYLDITFPSVMGPALALFPIAMGFGVLRYSLFDIKVVIRRTLPYAVLMALIGVVYAASIQGLHAVTQALGAEPLGASWFVPLLLVALGFQPVLETTQKVLDRLFFRREADIEKTVAEAGEHFLAADAPCDIEKNLLACVREALAVESAVLLLGKSRIDHATSDPEDAPIPLGLIGEENPSEHDRRLHRQAGRWRLSQSEEGLRKQLRDHGFVAVFPLEAAGRRGVLACGEKRSHLPFSDRDAMLLDALLSQAEGALARLAARAEASSARRMSDALVDSMDNAVAVMGLDGEVRRCNRAFTETLGRSLKEDLSAAIERSLKGSIEFQIGDRSFVVSSRRLDAEDAESIVVATDVTELRQLQESDRRKRHLAELGQFVSSMNHEIMNILSPINYLIAEIEESNSAEESARSVRELSERIRTLQNMSSELREYYTAPRMVFEDFQVCDVVESALQDVRTMSEGVWTPPELIGLNVGVRAEPQKLKQVLVNVLKNAWESMLSCKDRGPAWSVAAALEGERVRITVSDNGAGMKPAHLERAFAVFFSTKTARGSGLGLSIARKIVESHGGKIIIRSKEGEGATVEIDLPAGAVSS